MTFTTVGLTDDDSSNDESSNDDSSDGESAVRATVSYADVFDMPIKIEHLHRFLVRAALTPAETALTVDRLVARNDLARSDNVIYLPGRDEVVGIYHERAARAATMWRDAELWGRRIGRVPFVRMVAVTGGLAVDSVADHDDIDFFIVTRPGRLWLTRLMIIGLGRIADRNDIDLCPNYLVSDQAVQMDEHTIYVARELAQMVALVGPELCADVRRRNGWMFDFLPNATIYGDLSHATAQRPTRLQRAAERLLLLAPFGLLERWEMNRKITKLTRVTSRRPEVGAPDESSFSADVCKGHMVGNAAGIADAWQQRLSQFPNAEIHG